jgi:hypothetical protein
MPYRQLPTGANALNLPSGGLRWATSRRELGRREVLVARGRYCAQALQYRGAACFDALTRLVSNQKLAAKEGLPAGIAT